MHRRDYIETEIEKIGRALGHILGLREKGESNQAIDYVNSEVGKELNVTLELLLSLSDEAVLKLLKEKNLTAGQLYYLAEMLFEIVVAEPQAQNVKESDLKRILLLYEMGDKSTSSFNYEYLIKKVKIKSLLSNKAIKFSDEHNR